MRQRGIELVCAIGVNTGEVFAAAGAAQEQYPAGDTFYVAARLQQTAQGGELLIGEQTHGFVENAVRAEALGPMAVKGRTGRVSTWRVIELSPEDDAALPVPSTPFVGRDIELGELRGLLEAVRAAPGCQICTVVGPPGIGKSRLVRELRAAVGHETTAVLGRCAAYDKASPIGRRPTSSGASGTATCARRFSTFSAMTSGPMWLRAGCSGRSGPPRGRRRPARRRGPCGASSKPSHGSVR